VFHVDKKFPRAASTVTHTYIEQYHFSKMEGNIAQQECKPASTGVDKDDLVIPVNNSLSPSFRTMEC